jgi:hypothetical protein
MREFIFFELVESYSIKIESCFCFEDLSEFNLGLDNMSEDSKTISQNIRQSNLQKRSLSFTVTFFENMLFFFSETKS